MAASYGNEDLRHIHEDGRASEFNGLSGLFSVDAALGDQTVTAAFDTRHMPPSQSRLSTLATTYTADIYLCEAAPSLCPAHFSKDTERSTQTGHL
ncbi:uncharacterized protein UV8b_05797 [Ustilaginoidea virens]|uniref:Uncharacterized protein n=1 Tax=Ustilaginoidea virens TaxID=1159556 RepID=A0A8E5HUN6_USTVR|nr:uncharacterized protein UV8b_05797 [Ustilaginoidea virens]QUC21554.1 hypothetical protein UV8b_05797 [Ustilaginoidea virens]